MPKIPVFVFAFFLSFLSFSQKATLIGNITDTDKIPIYNTVIALLTPKDSILYKFTRSDKNGKFELKNLKTGTFILMTSHNQFADFTDTFEINENENTTGNISLFSKSKLLREVIIKSGSIRIKGDTTSYRASDFRVNANANVEDLLKKLPGIQVNKNGEIKAMGETVKKVLVDGEEFFGDDPGMAVKNLRADAVKEVQVFDKKSDQAEFTGIDDGNKQKTINLKLKDDAKKGYFGKIDAANGPLTNIDSRYNTNVLYSSFKGKRKLSAFLLNGNTGQDGLNWEDNEKFGGGNDNFSMNMDDDGNVNYEWNDGNDDDEPQVDTQNGFIKNTNAGLQYSNKWNDKQTLNLTPKFNQQDYTNTNKRLTKTQVGQNQLNDNTATITNVDRKNFKLNATYEVKIDSMNTLKISTKNNFYFTKSNAFTNGNTTDENEIIKNKRQVNLDTQSDKNALSSSILFKHKFAKKRRTFSVNGSWNQLNTSVNNFLKSDNEGFTLGVSSANIIVDQNKIGNKTTQTTSLNLAYTEPLSKKFALQIGYQIDYNTGKNNQLTYDFSGLTNNYDVLVTDLSNHFKQTITIQKPNLKLSYNSKKINYSFGTGFGFTNFDLLDQSVNKDYNRNFTNFFPSANFSYKYKSNANLRINYNGSTIQPTLDQLQPLRNNQDFFNQIIGNPDLKQAFRNTINLNHSSYSILTESHFYQGLYASTTANLISFNRDFNPNNAQSITKAINTNGNFSVNFYAGYGSKFKKLNIDYNVNPSFGYSKSINSINNIENTSNNLNSNLSIYLSKSVEKKYDINLNNEFGNNRNSTTQNDEIKSFYTNKTSISVGIFIKEKWKISSDYDLFVRQKTTDFQSDLSNQLWNMRLQRTFKNDEFTAYLLVRDILNQNIGIQRFTYDNTISEEQNDRLKRYAMLGFTWNFRNKNDKKQ